MSQRKRASSKKRKIDNDAATNPRKKLKSVKEFVQHLRSSREIFGKRADEIHQTVDHIRELSKVLSSLQDRFNEQQQKYKEDLKELKKETAEKIPDGVAPDPDLFSFDFWAYVRHPIIPNIAVNFNRQIRQLEDDPKKALMDCLNGEWKGKFPLSISGIGEKYEARLNQALPIEDFKQIEKILGKKRAEKIALDFVSDNF